MTPMQEQYKKIKNEYPDTILFFRLGDFFEVFDEDAIKVSKVLGLTLTGRGKGKNRREMAGVPHHALNNYLPKLVKAGLKVAIADQTEEAVPGKLVERKVTKVITAGTITDDNSLNSSNNNFIACVYINELHDESQLFNLAYADITTGEFKVFSSENALVFKNEIHKIKPSEVLCSFSQFDRVSIIFDGLIEKIDDSEFNLEKCTEILKDQLDVESLKGFGVEDENFVIISSGVLIKYLSETQKQKLNHIKKIKSYNYSDYMQLDVETIKNLELVYSYSGDTKTTLLGILDQTMTSMGSRMLRSSVLNPIVDEEILLERQDCVEYFYENPILNSEVQDILSSILDLERISGKIGYGSANPKDIKALENSLTNSLNLIKVINQSDKDIPQRIESLVKSLNIKDIQNLISNISDVIEDDPSAIVADGGYIREGFNSEVDELKNLKKNSRKVLENIKEREIESTGISSLKIGFNKVFGYYIEVTNIHTEKVPETFIRKQTLANAERYITQELKELEEKILTGEEQLIELEKQIFFQLIEDLSSKLPNILDLASCIAEIDLVSNLAFVARENEYTRPEVKKNQNLKIVDGRHPVVEKIIKKSFVPNSTEFGKGSRVHILTGPNMSGKSTYIRQVALICLMAHIGSFVPATSMKFSIIDRIFTRVGASDNLAKGESTFMVEMSETANILNNATKESLIILDEVGRGTSTYDGVAIAWSIIDFISNKVKAKTLFATHYHELIDLESNLDDIKNFNVEVDESGEEIKFLYKIKRGGTNKSYGIHVAKIAGIPEEVTTLANNILNKFEKGESNTKEVKKQVKNTRKSTSPKRPKKINPGQLELI